MEALFLSPYRWLLEPPLEFVRRGEGQLVIFIPISDLKPSALELLDKIIAAIHFHPSEATIAVARLPLSRERLNLFPMPLLWVMGSLLSYDLKVGIYDRESWKPVPAPHGFPNNKKYLYVLPSLGQMLEKPQAKKVTWQWIRGLDLKS
ncbi:MAG: hypothetical protein RMK19_09040 [Bacteroidia bacterium]|nr:hypothetical protein [Bacteroidia bacterium]MDW8016137.1 hypothetical protein [Bacteroidia bacterium]